MQDRIADQYPLPMPMPGSKEPLKEKKIMRGDFSQRGKYIKQTLLMTNKIIPMKAEKQEGMRVFNPTDKEQEDWEE